ncbi:MAG: uroporphyrinogen-III C-methyltransferase [Gammaproteobacteria bacterium]|nr:uroporphyrinogen-III C-methyltransferase [Gammaproteobacteria bacterium]
MADSKKSTSKQRSGKQTGNKKVAKAASKATRKQASTSAATATPATAPVNRIGGRPERDDRSSPEPNPATQPQPTATHASARAAASASRHADSPPSGTGNHGSTSRDNSGPGALTWLSLLLAVLACAALGLLLVSKGMGYFSSPDAGQMAAAALTNHPRLSEIDSALSEQQQQLRSAVDDLQDRTSQQAELQHRISALDSTVQTTSSAAASTNSEQTASINQLQGQQQNQARRMNELEATVAQLQARQNDSEAEIQHQFALLQLQQRLDEISTVLRSGRQQLLLNGNQQAALDAYDLATRALMELPTGAGLITAAQVGALQQALISERAQLASVAVTDVNTLLAELNGLADASRDWPLQQDHSNDRSSEPATTDTTANSTADPGLWQKLRGNLGHLVTVRNTDQPQLNIDEQLKLKRHLQLQLRTAALLALQQREDAWHSSLDNIDAFIGQWFVTDDRSVAAAQQRLRELDQIELNPRWPQPDQAMQLLASMQASASMQRR